MSAIGWLWITLIVSLCGDDPAGTGYVWTTAFAVPRETTNQGSGYFSIIEGANRRLYVGAAKYGENAYLVEFDPEMESMRIVVDAHKEIGSTASGFAAQAKIHTRNNVGTSGRIYFGTKQGYPMEGESRDSYHGGYPMWYDPATGKTRVYPIPVPHHGIISIAPDESRGLAYVSTCDDGRPIDSTHFLVLDLEAGTYIDLGDMRHMYAYIVVDAFGRAWHPMLGGRLARYDPGTKRLDHLDQSIDGAPPASDSHLADAEGHPINWDLSPDRKTLYAVAMSGNQLYAYDLAASGECIPGRRLGALCEAAEATDCRAMCCGPDGTVWAGVAVTYEGRPQRLHLVRYCPGDGKPVDLGSLAISNPDYTTFVDADEKPLPWHHGVERLADGTLVPRYTIMGICAARDGNVYLTTLAPFTLHRVSRETLRAVE
jgi:sugar lactone lactonase YvrE